MKYAWQEKLESRIKQYLEGYTACHDFYHHERVKNWALKIAKEIKCDEEILVAAALLHDMGYRNHEDDDRHHHIYSMALAKKWLPEIDFPKNKIDDVLKVIKLHDNLGRARQIATNHIETKILQDADKIDALGATGIARLTYYYGERGRLIYNHKPVPKSEKLWLNHSLLDQMKRDALTKWEKLHFPISKKLSKSRHDFVVNFYDELQRELKSEDL